MSYWTLEDFRDYFKSVETQFSCRFEDKTVQGIFNRLDQEKTRKIRAELAKRFLENFKRIRFGGSSKNVNLVGQFGPIFRFCRIRKKHFVLAKKTWPIATFIFEFHIIGWQRFSWTNVCK